MTVTVTDPAPLLVPPADYDGRTMVTPPPDSVAVAGATFPIISAHA